jgi:hypothetical protein
MKERRKKNEKLTCNKEESLKIQDLEEIMRVKRCKEADMKGVFIGRD